MITPPADEHSYWRWMHGLDGPDDEYAVAGAGY